LIFVPGCGRISRPQQAHCCSRRSRNTLVTDQSAGFDTCEGDPLGGFALQPEDFQPIGKAIASLGLPMVVVQEGGYVVDLLGRCAKAWVAGLMG
jgi:acetoin utilization deacetylase AcuC-like enzyme